jgi:hypothetical protein
MTWFVLVVRERVADAQASPGWGLVGRRVERVDQAGMIPIGGSARRRVRGERGGGRGAYGGLGSLHGPAAPTTLAALVN